MKTVDFLDAIRRRYDCSDYKAAQLLGIGRGTASSYRRGRTAFSDAIAIRAAELLDLDPGYVLAAIAAERTPVDSARIAWEKAARRLAKLSATALFIVAATIGSFGVNSGSYAASVAPPTSRAMYIMTIARAIVRRLANGLNRILARFLRMPGGLVSRSVTAAA